VHAANKTPHCKVLLSVVTINIHLVAFEKYQIDNSASLMQVTSFWEYLFIYSQVHMASSTHDYKYKYSDVKQCKVSCMQIKDWH